MRRFGPVLIAALVCAGDARPCSVPVFRYALENWVPSKYELLVRGADEKTVEALRQRAKLANIQVRATGATDKPELILRFPDSTEQIPNAWTGAIDADRFLFVSPARKQLVDRLKGGYAGVVLLLLSGNAEQDTAARAFLGEHVPRIAGRIELPKKTDDGPQIKWAAPVRVEFPVIEVARTPEEEVFVQILLGSEDGLHDVKGPIAFPVFGRGRALCSLHGRDLEKPSELHRSLEFLCRACSCQVKELNPGLDLLLATDWEAPPEPVAPPPTNGLALYHGAIRVPTPSEVGTVPLVEPTDDSGRPLQVALVAAAGAVCVSGVWVILSRRRPG